LENQVVLGDCLEKMKSFPHNSVDLLVTDPPYGYSFMGKDWDKVIVGVEIWKECLRVLKSGSFAFVMSAPRQDVLSRMMINLEKAGFVMGFTSMYWAYASGFPKAMNISKSVDKKLGVEGEIVGTEKGMGKQNPDWNGTNQGRKENSFKPEYEKTKPTSPQAKKLDGSYAGFQPKPALEVILVCMKPLSEKNYLEQTLYNSKGVTWLDDCRVPYRDKKDIGDPDRCKGYPVLDPKKGWNQNSLINNVTIGEKGRFPANLIVSDGALDIGKNLKTGDIKPIKTKSSEYQQFHSDFKTGSSHGDSGDFSRFFDLDAWEAQFIVTPKPSRSEKNRGLDEFTESTVTSKGRTTTKNTPYLRPTLPRKNTHPTIKPLKLMQYLITLGSREGDIVLDPFSGSGTTGLACIDLNRKYILIEKEQQYYDIINERITNWKTK